MKIFDSILLFSVFFTSIAFGAQRTSVASGDFLVTSNWDCNCVPGSNDTVTIATGDTITLFAKETVGLLTVESGAQLDISLFNLTVKGNLHVDGEITGDAVLNWTNGTELSGSGTISNSKNFNMKKVDKTLVEGGHITRLNGNTRMVQVTFTNKGTLDAEKNVLGSEDSLSTFINDTNATLHARKVLMSKGLLYAAAPGNVIYYDGSVNQNIFPPADSLFRKVIIEGSKTKTLQGEIWITDTLELNSAKLKTNNHSIVMLGQWINTGCTFQGDSATIKIQGGGTQTYTCSGGDTFFDLEIESGTSFEVISGAVLTIEDTISIAGELINSGTVTLAGGFNPTATGQISGNGNLIVTGGLWNDGHGAFQAGTGYVEFAGSTGQRLNGYSDFRDLRINNAAGVTMTSGNTRITEVLTMTSGTLTTNDSLTLVSDATQTARIGSIPGGASIVGDVIVERYFGTSDQDYRLISPTTSNSTLEDWDEEIYTTGFVGSDYPNMKFNNIYTYDETVLGTSGNGYQQADSIQQALVPGLGYMVYLYVGDELTLNNKGTVNQGDIALPVSFTDDPAQNDDEDGWNLVGNPYPSAIDWDAATGWTKTNIDDALYIWNPALQQYATYIAGVGTNGGSRHIATGQAFWVKANAASPVLDVTEDVKSTEDPAFMKAGKNATLLTFRAHFGNWMDEATIHGNPNGGHAYNPRTDAIDFVSHNPDVPNVSIGGWDTTIYSIKSLNNQMAHDSAELTIDLPAGESFSLEVILDDWIFAGNCIELIDLSNNEVVFLTQDTVLEFTTNATTQRKFKLNLNRGIATIQARGATCHGQDNGSIIVEKAAGAGYSWMTADFELFENIPLEATDWLNENVPAGVYYLVGQSGCGFDTTKININQPDAMNIESYTIDPVCQGELAAVTVSVTGGAGKNKYLYSWSDGVEGLDANTRMSLNPGVYTLTVTDALHCAQIITYDLEAEYAIEADFTIDELMTAGDSSKLQNFTTGATDFLWQISNGEVSERIAPGVVFDTPGTAWIELIAQNEFCTDSHYMEVEVTAPSFKTGITDIAQSPLFELIGNQVVISEELQSLRMINAMGQVLPLVPTNQDLTGQMTTSGLYTIEAYNGAFVTTVKVVR